MNPLSKQLNAEGIKDEQKPEGGRGDWQTARTSYSFEVAVSSREQCFMEMSLVSFAAVPVYWCLCRGTVDRLLLSGQTDVNLSSEDELPFEEQQISFKLRNVDTFIQVHLLSCKKVRWRPRGLRPACWPEEPQQWAIGAKKKKNNGSFFVCASV